MSSERAAFRELHVHSRPRTIALLLMDVHSVQFNIPGIAAKDRERVPTPPTLKEPALVSCAAAWCVDHDWSVVGLGHSPSDDVHCFHKPGRACAPPPWHERSA